MVWTLRHRYFYVTNTVEESLGLDHGKNILPLPVPEKLQTQGSSHYKLHTQ